jgi:hypothetical protein
MLKVRLGRIIDYISEDRTVVERAFKEFFKNVSFEKLDSNLQAQVFPLFNEWLIFEYKLLSGSTPIAEYFLRNPNQLPNNQIKELEQIVKTQKYEMLEIDEVKRGEWIMAYGLLSGKNYKIYDIKGSLTIQEKGVFYGRIAKVNGKWILVGSDTVVFPISYTKRAKKTFLNQSGRIEKISCKDLLSILISTDKKEIPKYTKKQIKAKQKKLKKKYESIAKKNNLKVSFNQVTDFIYEENYKSNHAGWLKDLIKLGVFENVVFNHTKLFSNIWNFFPHKKLNGKTPAELYSSLKNNP